MIDMAFFFFLIQSFAETQNEIHFDCSYFFWSKYLISEASDCLEGFSVLVNVISSSDFYLSQSRGTLLAI